MATTLTFDTTDPSMLSALLKAQSSKASELAPRCELWSWAKDYRMAHPAATVDELRNAFIEHKNDIAREMSGHKEFPYDIPDDLHQLLGLAEGAVKLIPIHGKEIAEGVVELGKGIMELTPVEEWAKNYHSENGADATANIVANYYSICDKIVADVAPMLRNDPVFNQALGNVDPDAAAGGRTIPTAPGDVLRAHKEVFNQTIINEYFTIQADSGLSAQIEDVQQTLKAQLGGSSTQMQQQYTSLHGDIAQLQAGQTTLLEYVHAQKKRQEQADAAAARKAQYEAVFAGAQTAVNVLATVAGLVDPKLGRQIAQVGTAYVQVGHAALDMVNAVTKCMSSTLTAASALGAAVATGNFIGAALNLVSVFTGLGGGQSPDQMILEQIGQLRQQIDAFHQDMTARFDQVDRELNTIYSNVMTALNKIDIRLGRIEEAVDRIEEAVDRILSDIVEEQIKLDRLIRSLDAYFTNQYRLPLQIAINTDLGWTSGQPMSMDEFMRARGVFYTFACQAAYADPQESPVDNRPTDNFSLTEELSRPADQNIAFANHVLAARGWPTFASDVPGRRLPNPLMWSIAAAAYAQLEAEQHVLAAAADAGASHSKRDDVREGGLQLSQASALLRSLLLPGPGAANAALLDKLLDNYTSAIHDWAHAVDDPASYRHWPKSFQDPTQTSKPTNPYLWDGPDQYQYFGYTPLGLLTTPAPSLPPLANLSRAIPSLFLVADWFGLGKVSVTYEFDSKVQRRFLCGHDLETHTPIYCSDGYTWLEAIVSYQDTQVWNCHVGNAYYQGTRDNPDGPPITRDELLRKIWGDGKQALSGQALESESALTAATRAAVSIRINELRAEYFTWIADEFRPPTSATPHPLFYTQATAIDGARALLDLLISFGFEQPRYGDDLLRALFDGAPQPNGLRLPDSADLLTALVGRLDPSAEGNWWLGTFNSPQLNWTVSANPHFADVSKAPFWGDNFTGAGKSEILFYSPSAAISGSAFTLWSDALIATPRQLIHTRLQQWQEAAAQKLWKPTLLAAERNLLRLGAAEAIVTAETIAHG